MTPTEFAALYASQAPRVRRVVAAGLRPGDQSVAEDLTHDVFLALWRRVDRGDQIDRPSSLLTVMARHRVIDHYRSARVRRELPTDPTAYGPFDQSAARELVTA